MGLQSAEFDRQLPQLDRLGAAVQPEVTSTIKRTCVKIHAIRL
jgi:hypothetical protein